MSNHDSRLAARSTTGRPTATYPTGHPTGHPALSVTGPSPFAGWRDQCPTETLPVISPAPSRHPADRAALAALARERAARAERPSQHEGAADAASLSHGGARPRAVYHTSPQAPSCTPSRERRHRPSHLRSALVGIALAALILTGLQLYAASGITSARQAALQSAQSPMSGRATPMSDRTFDARSDVRSDIQAEWVTEDTGAPYDRTDPAASPLDLPRCTTSPDTPLPCLATISPDSRRAVVLEEDASLTALVRR